MAPTCGPSAANAIMRPQRRSHSWGTAVRASTSLRTRVPEALLAAGVGVIPAHIICRSSTGPCSGRCGGDEAERGTCGNCAAPRPPVVTGAAPVHVSIDVPIHVPVCGSTGASAGAGSGFRPRVARRGLAAWTPGRRLAHGFSAWSSGRGLARRGATGPARSCSPANTAPRSARSGRARNAAARSGT